jgi:hypothetical protein
MNRASGRILALFIIAALCAAAPAGAAVKLVWGDSWDGPSASLQNIVNGLVGTGKINVTTDYLGAKTGDPDPWFWIDSHVSALLVTEIAGNANRNQVGWYLETGAKPVLKNDGLHDELIFDGPASSGATALVTFSGPMTKFGFYLNPNGPGDATNAPEPEMFYTNRTLNDLGPDGSGTIHNPWGGDVQALIYDISPYFGDNTWLVCFEDLDSGANPGAYGTAQTDNDWNDFVFKVTAYGATPVEKLSFGALKARYQH